MTVGEVFEKPDGPVRLDPDGKWWMSRRALAVENDGTVTIEIADGKHVAEVTGTPMTLQRLAEAITAQIDSALVNTEVET